MADRTLIDTHEQDGDTIWKACQDIAATDPDRFAKVQSEEVTMMIDKRAQDIIRRMIETVARIYREDIRFIPQGNRPQLSGALRRIQDLFQYIESTPASTLVQNNDIPSRTQQTWYSFQVELAWFFAVTGLRPEDQRQLDSIQLMVKEKSAHIEAQAKEASNLLASMRAASAEAGVSQHAEVFDRAVTEHGASKKGWLWTTVALAGAALGYGFWLMLNPPMADNLEGIIPAVTARLLVFGVLSYGLVWSARMFRAQEHNYIINKHRRDALLTFRTFVDGTDDSATKNLVLLQTTQSIFSHRPSGYGQQDPDSAPRSHMLELTRNIVQEGNPS